MDNLIKQFEKAGLPLVITREPIHRVNNSDVFQMDIARKLRGGKRSEFFRIWRGNSNNKIQVTNVDKDLKQLILMVHEPRREFAVKHILSRHQIAALKKQAAKEGRDWKSVISDRVDGTVISISEKARVMEVLQKTPQFKRHYLVGVDERQLFIAQVPKAITTVKQAHQELKGARVETAEGRAPGRTLRQGEWFFLNPTPAELQELKRYIKKNRTAIVKKAPLPGGGNPHTADEMVTMPAKRLRHGFPVNRSQEIYVRGRIRHKDHKTLKFASWRKVLRNAEGGFEPERSSRMGRGGIWWFD